MNLVVRNRAIVRVAVVGIIATLGMAGIRFGLLAPSQTQVIINGTAVPPVPTLNAVHVTAGEGLYRQYCASCHGAALEGAPNWKQRLSDGSLPPPPHD